MQSSASLAAFPATDPGFAHSPADATAYLEHLRRERYRDIMLEAGMPTEEELRQTLRTMERFGFLKMENPDSFRFKAPAYRFLDLCMELFKESEAAEGKI